MSTNSEVADIFEKIADSLDILGENSFKIRAYQKAAKQILELPSDVKELDKKQIMEINGVGNDLADKIVEYSETGKLEYYEKLKEKVPPDLVELLRIQGVGPKFLAILFKKFRVRNLEDFEKTLADESLLDIKGIGRKKVDEIKKGIPLFKKSKDRVLLSTAMDTAEEIIEEIKKIKGTKNTQYAGSLRRMKETIGDIDVITCAKNTEEVMEQFTKSGFVSDVIAKGKTKGSIITRKNINVDLRVVEEDEFGAALLYFTGSKQHNVRIRTLASKMGYKINEYGLFKGDKKIEGKSEEKIYKKLGLKYIEPEMREDRGEIEASRKSSLPDLVELKHIKGDLHTHSTWSDGKSTIVEMAVKAREVGYDYIAITDHSQSSRIANGLDEKRLMEKMAELERINEKTKGIKIVMGTEVDIKKDGTLDYSNDVLKKLDFVVASVHSNFRMERDEMTERILKAVENPHVHAIGHPTGRLLGEREPYEIDIDALIDAAKKHGKALEINGSYKRLDLNDLNARKAVEKGVKVIISTDAHSRDNLTKMVLGIGTARRAWVKKSDVINTYSLKKLMEWLDGFK